MTKIYFTIAATKYHYGQDIFEKGMTVRLVKEPENDHDREAIKVEAEGLGQVGYVANSPWTVEGESYSAGRLYDKIGDTAEGTVMYVLEKGILCQLNETE
ncbi:MAG: HIRAN domain-containing protein [Bacillota bacterium]|nr:HIRAN domain-containing protein [Bacillota bacterium]